MTRSWICGSTLFATLALAVAGSAGIACAADTPSRMGVSESVKAGNVSRDADLAVVTNTILNKWQPIATKLGVNDLAWREVFATQLSQMNVAALSKINAINPDGNNAKASYAQFTQAFRNATMQRYVLAQSDDAANSKTQTKLGSSTDDQVFIPIVPCRVVDTRSGSGGSGPIAAGTQRAFYFFNAGTPWSWQTNGPDGVPQGGAPGQAASVCPGTTLTGVGGTLGSVSPSAAMATITVVSPTAAGNLIAWGGAGTFPQSTVVNFTAGQNLANTTVIPAGGRAGGPVRDFTVRYNGPSGQADVVVDVVGYFVENKATALDCVYLIATGSGADLPNNALMAVPVPVCTAGYTKTGTGCSFNSGAPGELLEVSTGHFNDCYWLNNTGVSVPAANYNAETACCRVPGQ